MKYVQKMAAIRCSNIDGEILIEFILKNQKSLKGTISDPNTARYIAKELLNFADQYENGRTRENQMPTR